MDKFLASLFIMVFSVLAVSTISMFESKTSASTLKEGVAVMLESANGRKPAIGNNRE